jgi:NAD(P)-dependent dehydrogenase (short-subunit alcohol dehydrogenase family)
LEWKDQPGDKLENQLPTIIQDLLGRAELFMRRSAQFVYEHRVERRAEIVKQLEAAERAREAQRLEKIAAHRKRVRQHIIDLGEQHRAAIDIRDMVKTLSAHPDLGPQGRSQFYEWVRLALGVADELDPMKRSLDVIVNGAGAAPAG